MILYDIKLMLKFKRHNISKLSVVIARPTPGT